jgi:magnesium transporter
MLRLFNIDNGMLKEQSVPNEPFKQAVDAAWIDAHDPSDDERTQLQAFLRTALPESDDVEEIESSARYFADNIGVHVRSLFLAQSEGRHHTATVAFILQNERLVTLREGALADFRLLRMRARRGQVEAHTL